MKWVIDLVLKKKNVILYRGINKLSIFYVFRFGYGVRKWFTNFNISHVEQPSHQVCDEYLFNLGVNINYYGT